MAPRPKRFWLPMMGLGAFFASVVCAGNVLLGAVYTPPPGLPESRSPGQYFERKVRRVWRTVERVRVRWLDATDPESALPGEGRFASGFLPEPVTDDDVTPGLRRPGKSEPEPSRYLRPAIEPATEWIEPVSRPRFRIDLASETWEAAERASLFERMVDGDLRAPALRSEALDVWSRWRLAQSDGFMVDVLDGVFGIPKVACDGIYRGLQWCFPPTGCYSFAQEDDRPMIARVVDLRDGGRMESPFREFTLKWIERTQRSYGDSYLVTFGVQEELEAVDLGDFMYEQRKILLEVVRKVYLSRYVGRSEDRLKDDLWRFREWHLIDVILGPPVIAAYTWFRGVERKFTLGATRLSVKLEPVYAIVESLGHAERDLVAALGVEWEIPGFPIKLLASAGVHDGEAMVDFVGIGTSLGMGKKAVRQVMEDDGTREER